MERRVLLAISLSFLVLFVYQTFFVPPPSPPPQTGPAPLENTTPAVPPPATSIAGIGSPGNLSPGSPAAPPPPAAVVGDTEERQIVVETQRVRAVFTNRGGRLRHWQLKEHKTPGGQPLDLVPAVIPSHLPLPFSLRTEDATTTTRLNQSLYKASGMSSGTVDATTASATITFESETADGLRARKTFTLAPDSYLVQFSAQVQQGDKTLNPIVDMGPGLGDDIARTSPGSFFSPNYIYLAQAILLPASETSPERLPATSLGAGTVREGDFKWAGVDDHYFISAAIPPPSRLRLEFVPVSIPSTDIPPVVGTFAAYSVQYPAPPENARFFMGPKQLDELRAVDPEFTRAIYFGMFAFLAVPLLGALTWVNGFIGNWGWSIIVLTILINLAMFPLRHKSVVSMRKMQELQPQMKAIQDRYAKYKVTDPERQKMNQEVMDLYKAKGVNPASGCVPMLLTMPFLFAFYAMLSQAIEIKGAPFMGWIHDLAARDPYYITPLLMGVTMFWQQKMTPTTADPTQQKVMMIMPFMFTAMFLPQPSGLAIYWFVSNLWGIGQQYFTNYLIGAPKVHNVRPAAERKVKKESK